MHKPYLIYNLLFALTIKSQIIFLVLRRHSNFVNYSAHFLTIAYFWPSHIEWLEEHNPQKIDC